MRKESITTTIDPTLPALPSLFCKIFSLLLKTVPLAAMTSATFAYAGERQIEIDVEYIRYEIEKEPSNTAYRVILAKYYIQKGEIERSERLIEEAVKIDPTDRNARKLLETVKEYKRLLAATGSRPPLDRRAAAQKIDSYMREGEYEKCTALYTLADGFGFASDEKSIANAAICYAKMKKAGDAQRLAAKLEEGSEESMAAKIYLLLPKGDLQGALKLLKRLEKRAPGSSYAKYAEKEIRRTASDMARSSRERALSKGSIKDLNDHIYLLSLLKRETDTESFLKEFLRLYPQSMDARLTLARRYYWKGEYKKSIELLEAAPKKSYESKSLLAAALYENGDYRRALPLLMEAAGKAGDRQSRLSLMKKAAFAYEALGDFAHAQELAGELLKGEPDDEDLAKLLKRTELKRLLRAAAKSQKRGDTAGALKLYKRYLHKSGDFGIAAEIAQIHYFEKEYEKSLPYFEMYLRHFDASPETLFRYADALQMCKRYAQSVRIFEKVSSKAPEGELGYLARYRYAYNLMQLQSDREWIEARETLQNLYGRLKRDRSGRYRSLEKFTARLLKTAMGEPRKPTYYKDIVLTEGAKKYLDKSAVFSDVYFITSRSPANETLLHIHRSDDKSPIPGLSFEYLSDDTTTFRSYRLSALNFATVDDIKYSAAIKRFTFDFSQRSGVEGNSISLEVGVKDVTFGVGFEESDEFKSVVPTFRWTPVVGLHSLYLEAAYRNGLFASYRGCMLDSRTNALTLAVYDTILTESLEKMHLDLTVNSYDDGNTNVYASFQGPVYVKRRGGIKHAFLFSAAAGYNTKTDLCYRPARSYDTLQLLYRPEIRLESGSLALSLGTGYSFGEGEAVYSYGVSLNGRVFDAASIELSCEETSTSYLYKEIRYCSFNLTKAW